MRVARLLQSSLIVILLSTTGCGGSPPPAAAAPEATKASDAPSAGEQDLSGKPAGDDQGWAGESTGTAVTNDAPSDKPVGDEPAAPGGKGPETRTMAVIQKVIVDNRKPARRCYEDARKDDKDLQGNVVVHFVLDPEGKVKSADLNQERSTLTSPAVVDCVIAVIKRLKFPRSSRAMETTANYPFNFTP